MLFRLLDGDWLMYILLEKIQALWNHNFSGMNSENDYYLIIYLLSCFIGLYN